MILGQPWAYGCAPPVNPPTTICSPVYGLIKNNERKVIEDSNKLARWTLETRIQLLLPRPSRKTCCALSLLFLTTVLKPPRPSLPDPSVISTHVPVYSTPSPDNLSSPCQPDYPTLPLHNPPSTIRPR
ncbi:hypothetical protein BDW62DRAFT_120928 [Aspergillus aurantiobrunneus]